LEKSEWKLAYSLHKTIVGVVQKPPQWGYQFEGVGFEVTFA
jgi:hypothetical protein